MLINKNYGGVWALICLSMVGFFSVLTVGGSPAKSLVGPPSHDVVSGSEKRKIVVKVPPSDLQLLNHKGLLAGFQKFLEDKYVVVYTTDLQESADVLVVMGFSRNFVVWRNFLKDSYRWLFGIDKNIVTPQLICRDSAPVKILYAHETWTSFPEGFDDCFDLMIGYDQRVDHQRYMTVAGTAYEFFHEKISTDYQPEKDIWRAEGCHPERRKYDVGFFNSNAGGKDFMDLAIDRINLFNAFSKRTYVASGGKFENNIGYIVPRGEELDWMMNCKFVIGYENRIYPGYITEKPYQAWLAGAIPIYAAHRSVLGNISRDAVVFGPDFDSNEAIVDHVMGLLDDPDAYCSIWQKPLHGDTEKNFYVLQEAIKHRLIDITEEKLEGT